MDSTRSPSLRGPEVPPAPAPGATDDVRHARARRVVRFAASSGAIFVPLLLSAVTVAIVAMIAAESIDDGLGELVVFTAMATIGGTTLIGAGMADRAGGAIRSLALATILAMLGVFGAVVHFANVLLFGSPDRLPTFTRTAMALIATGAVLVVDQSLAVRRITSPPVGVLVTIARICAWLVFIMVAGLLTLAGNVPRYSWMGTMLPIMSLAIAILVTCGLTAASLARRFEARDVAARDTLSVTAPLRLVCPKCATALAFRPGVHLCTGCRFAIKVAIEEPRCLCGYVLYRITGATCPECGAILPKDAVRMSPTRP